MKRPRNLNRYERGIACRTKVGEGREKVVDFLLWKIMRLDLDSDVRKPCLESQIDMEAIVD